LRQLFLSQRSSCFQIYPYANVVSQAQCHYFLFLSLSFSYLPRRTSISCGFSPLASMIVGGAKITFEVPQFYPQLLNYFGLGCNGLSDITNRIFGRSWRLLPCWQAAPLHPVKTNDAALSPAVLRKERRFTINLRHQSHSPYSIDSPVWCGPVVCTSATVLSDAERCQAVHPTGFPLRAGLFQYCITGQEHLVWEIHPPARPSRRNRGYQESASTVPA